MACTTVGRILGYWRDILELVELGKPQLDFQIGIDQPQLSETGLGNRRST
jgi:hypothetical protein